MNQYATVGSATPTYDGRGNLTSDGAGRSYSYYLRDLEYAIPGGYLYYDPLGRLDYIGANSVTGAIRTFDYDGDRLIGEISTLQRRYVHGPGSDEVLVWYEGAGTTDRRWLHADERGSTIAVSDASGNATALNRYDEYGTPAATNIGRFQYTGQAWLPELGAYYYKARIYSPALGRFLQSDPVGYAAGMNLYAYVGADPVNRSDPSGLSQQIISYQVCLNTSVTSIGDDGTYTSSGPACYTNYLIFETPERFGINFESGGGGGGGGGDSLDLCFGASTAYGCAAISQAPSPPPPPYCSRPAYKAGSTISSLGVGIKAFSGLVAAAGLGQIAGSPTTAGVSAGTGLATLGSAGAIFELGQDVSALGSFVQGLAGSPSGRLSTTNGLAAGAIGIGASLSSPSQRGLAEVADFLTSVEAPDRCH